MTKHDPITTQPIAPGKPLYSPGQDLPNAETNKPVILKPWQRVRVTVDLEGQESQTDTSQGNDTDINNIVERFARTGTLPEGPSVQPIYEDVTGLQGDMTEMIEKGKTAQAELAKATKAAQEAAQKEIENQAEANAAKIADLEAQVASLTPNE